MIPSGFKQRIGKVAIALSQFVDTDGIWAKDWKDCVSVNVTFEDAYEVSLEPDDFMTLPKEQQDLVRHAPSSPPA
jgi:hypothetical protein